MSDEMRLEPEKPRGAMHGKGPAPAKAPSAPAPRRDFLTKSAAVVTGGAIVACPVAAGVAVLIDPLKRAAGEARFLRVASLASLPDDGVPRQFPVISEFRDDAWTRYTHEPIGAVFLRRDAGSAEVKAWSAICTHAGCFVPYNAEAKQFQCPCHTGVFDKDGKTVSGPPPRDMDSLECEVRDGEVYVKYQDYYAGIADKKAKI